MTPPVEHVSTAIMVIVVMSSVIVVTLGSSTDVRVSLHLGHPLARFGEVELHKRLLSVLELQSADFLLVLNFFG